MHGTTFARPPLRRIRCALPPCPRSGLRIAARGSVLVGVRIRAERAAPDLVESLLECHERIRRFIDLAGRLATADAPQAQRAEAARSVARYFAVALPLHAEDEDLSIAPRLLRPSAPEGAAAAARRMTEEHGPIEALLEALRPRWEELGADPSSIAWQSSALADGAARLRVLVEPHLAMEEAVVFPAVPRVLSAAEMQSVLQEMRARRDPGKQLRAIRG